MKSSLARIMALGTLILARCASSLAQEAQSTNAAMEPENVNCSSLCPDDGDGDGNGTASVHDLDEIYKMIDEMYRYIYPKWYEWIFILMHLVVFMVGLVGNALVCIAVYRNHSMRTVTNYFIVNLAVADQLVIVICLPPTILWDITETWFLGLLPCKIVLYFQTVSVTVSVFTLTVISADRWYAICNPFSSKTTTAPAKKIILCIWIIALIIDVPELVVLETSTHVEPHIAAHTKLFTQCGPNWREDYFLYFTLFKLVFLYIVPLAFMTFAYFRIFQVLWSADIPGHNLSTRIMNANELSSQASMGNPEGQLKSRRKAAKMLFAVVGMFAFCCFPVHFLSILRFTMKIKATPLVKGLSCLVHWLFYANSAINPLIYNFMSGKFRKEFRRTFCCPGSDKRGAYRMAGLSKHPHSVKSTSFNNSLHGTRYVLTTFTNNNNNNNNNVRHSGHTEIVPLSGVCGSRGGLPPIQQQQQQQQQQTASNKQP